MHLQDIQFIFNRACLQTFEKRKLLSAFLIMALCGVLVVFFRGLSVNAGHWLLLSLTFLPFFLCAGILMSLGIILIRVYHDEIKKKEINYKTILSKSWEIVLGASYFSVPIILSYLLLWMLLGVFVLLREIPYAGEFFGAILAFAPFLINLFSLVLCLLSVSLLFFVTPIIALKGINRMQVSESLINRFNKDIFSNLLLAIISVLPAVCIVGLLILAGSMTQALCFTCENPISNVLEWFFIMIPFTAILAPAVVFFFNFAAESHVLILKETKETL